MSCRGGILRVSGIGQDGCLDRFYYSISTCRTMGYIGVYVKMGREVDMARRPPTTVFRRRLGFEIEFF